MVINVRVPIATKTRLDRALLNISAARGKKLSLTQPVDEWLNRIMDEEGL